MFVIPVLRGLRQEDQELKACLGFIVKPSLTGTRYDSQSRAMMIGHGDVVSQILMSSVSISSNIGPNSPPTHTPLAP